MSLINKLWSDENGFVVSSELVMIGTVLVIGMVVGMTSLRDQAAQEVADLAAAIGSVNESYSYSAVTGHSSSTAGSVFQDNNDYCELGPPDGPDTDDAGALGLFCGAATDPASVEL